MNKRTLLICISALSALVILVAGAVTLLYSEKSSVNSPSADELYEIAASSRPVMNAIPSDAVMILHCSTMRDCIDVVTDTTWTFGSMFSGSGKSNFRKFLSRVSMLVGDEARALRNSEMAVSMHYSGNIVPLMLVSVSGFPKDSTKGEWSIVRAADSARIAYRIFDNAGDCTPTLKRKTVLAFSPSETLVMSAGRNLESGTSVLKDEECAAAVASVGNESAIFVNHSYSGKIVSSFFASKLRGQAGFLKSFADWTALTINDMTDKRLALSGTSASFESPAFFSNLYKGIAPGTSTVMSVLPAGTLSASMLQLSSTESYITAYKKYIDAVGRLPKYNAALETFRTNDGVAPDVWVNALKIKEICKANVSVSGGETSVLLMKPGKDDPSQLFRGSEIKSVKEYDGGVLKSGLFASVGTLFGNIFSIKDSTYIFKDGRLICGAPAALEQFTAEKRRTLADYLSEAGAGSMIRSSGTVFQMYSSAAASPVVLSIEPGETSFFMNIEALQVKFTGINEDVPAAAKDTAVTVPSGPFKVKNCATGKTNLFSQQSNNWLVLKDEKGKGLWGVQFGSPICGAVSEIDYFGNGKIQFLFASGSKLYLIDRLGRFVKPFPVELGKEVLIGPAAYDFSGAHAYTAMVLHKDNTIGMYDLHGKTPSAWKGIKSEETIKSLPELLRVKGKRFWVVRTSVRTVIYGFDGGNPVYNPGGNKMLRPDAKIKVNDNGSVSALCHDGKERVLKL